MPTAIARNPFQAVMHEKATVLVAAASVAEAETFRAYFDEEYNFIPICTVEKLFENLLSGEISLVVIVENFGQIDIKTLCQLLRTDSRLERVPFVVELCGDDERKKEILAYGAKDCWSRNAVESEIKARVRFHMQNGEMLRRLMQSNLENEFLAQLGKNLLTAIAPEQVVTRVAADTYEATSAQVCALIADFVEDEPLVRVFNREGSAEGISEIFSERLEKWLEGKIYREPFTTENRDEFFLRDARHRVEFIVPLNVNNRTKGALVVAFDRCADLTETVKRLMVSAASLAAMSIHITSLYDAALDASVYMAKQEQKRFNEMILDALPLSIYAVDRDYQIVAWNGTRERGEQGIPREQAIGHNVFDVLTRQPRKIIEKEFDDVFTKGTIQRIEQSATNESGRTTHWLISKIPMRDETSGEVCHVISVGEDITARVEANRAVARADKLAAVGRLAAGVVHEINNPLATIAACAESLTNRVNEGAFGDNAEADDLRDYLNLIQSETFRCKSITMGLLDFSRVRQGVRSDVDLAQVVNSCAKLVTHQKRGSQIELRVEAAKENPLVSIDEGQIQQAVIALATNAIDAMPHGGTLSLRVVCHERRVAVEVEDTGIGIAPENTAKIFEPFFTTKETGKGTGLGLAVCYGIVTENGGTLNVRSALGKGTVFTMSFPISKILQTPERE